MDEIVYKFLPTNYALKVLEQKKLKLSTLLDLNDIYDWRLSSASSLTTQAT